MNRALDFLLQLGLAAASLAAIAYSLRALIGIATFSGSWNSAGLMAVYFGPIAFAGAMFLNGHSSKVKIVKSESTDA